MTRWIFFGPRSAALSKRLELLELEKEDLRQGVAKAREELSVQIESLVSESSKLRDLAGKLG